MYIILKLEERFMKYVVLVGIILFSLTCNNNELFIVHIKYSRAALWYVHPDSALNSIQEALYRCVDYDTVLVAAGTYYENLIWPNTPGIYLVSESGPEVTIIDGDNMGRVIMITEQVDSLTVIKGFTIQNGELDDIVENYGAGIFCDSFASPLIADNIIGDNYALSGGAGICCINSSAQIRNNIIRNNSCGSGFRGGTGAGILCTYGGSPVISGNTITGNTCGGMWSCQGAGIACWDCSAYIIGNTITNNENDSNAGIGGGIYCNSGTVWIIDNTISDNNTGLGAVGGIACYSSSIIIKHCDISSNSAWWYGGGIYCSSSSLVIDSCNVTDNDPDGIYIYSLLDSINVHYTNISGNTGYGLKNNVASYIVDAEYNWWGDSSGPGGSGPGTGDSVSLYVDYEPWFTEPMTF